MNRQQEASNTTVPAESREFGEKLVAWPLLINGALFTLTLVLLQNLLGNDHLSVLQIVSLVLFAIELPCLAGYSLIIYAIQAAKVDPQAKGKLFLWLQYMGIGSGLSGIWTNIMNSSWIAGLIFIVVFIIALVICAITYHRITELHARIYNKK